MTLKADANDRRGGLLGTGLAIALLYFGRDIFVPLALAVLLAFLLEPLARAFEKIKLGRVWGAVLAVAIALTVLGSLFYCVVGQFADFGRNLPKYEQTIHQKLRGLRAGGDGFFRHAEKSIQDFKKDLAPTNAAAVTNAVAGAVNLPKGVKVVPVAVHQEEEDTSPYKIAEGLIGPSLNFMVTLFLVILFCVFIMVERDDLRARLIRIFGSRNARLTNQLLRDTGGRVSRYLFMQLVVNVCYGTIIGLGLWAIGIPNPLLCGLLSTVLRYIPYAGPWIAAAVPLAIGVATESGWSKPAMVFGLYAVIELITANVIEPWLYGNSTGITPLAVLLAAVFWATLWGPIGLLLSVPLTVCLVAIARYVPQLELLDQLFGEDEKEGPAPGVVNGHDAKPAVAHAPAVPAPRHFRRREAAR